MVRYSEATQNTVTWNPAFMATDFPEWLKTHRELRGLSKNQLGIRADSNHVTVSTIENRKAPFSKKMVIRMANALCGEDTTDIERLRLVNEALASAGYMAQPIGNSDSALPTAEGESAETIISVDGSDYSVDPDLADTFKTMLGLVGAKQIKFGEKK